MGHEQLQTVNLPVEGCHDELGGGAGVLGHSVDVALPVQRECVGI